MNTNVMFSSKTDLWETPQNLFDKYDAIYHFETDVCALPENAKCKRFFPYGRHIGKWVEKAVKSFATVVMLYLREQTQNGFTICACHTERSSSCAGV